jgi:hypothetical protein
MDVSDSRPHNFVIQTTEYRWFSSLYLSRQSNQKEACLLGATEKKEQKKKEEKAKNRTTISFSRNTRKRVSLRE